MLPEQSFIGDYGTASATVLAIAGNYGVAVTKSNGLSSAGDYGHALTGNGGQAKVGRHGQITIINRDKIVRGYEGIDIEAGVYYKAYKGQLVKVE